MCIIEYLAGRCRPIINLCWQGQLSKYLSFKFFTSDMWRSTLFNFSLSWSMCDVQNVGNFTALVLSSSSHLSSSCFWLWLHVSYSSNLKALLTWKHYWRWDSWINNRCSCLRESEHHCSCPWSWQWSLKRYQCSVPWALYHHVWWSGVWLEL